MDKKIEKALRLVQKPGRYTGGELNSVIKDRQSVNVRFAFCFPDTYEIGMSHLGGKILYDVLNRMDGVWCERVFAPWTDFEDQMRQNDIELYGLESGDCIGSFDFIGFALLYEMTYTNVLNMLDLAHVPIRASERGDNAPVVIMGGPCTCNPEPMAPFADLVCLGEGEEVLPELVQLYRRFKQEGRTRKEFIKAAGGIKGIYVPSLYEAKYNEDGTVKAVMPVIEGLPERVDKRVAADIDNLPFPEKFVVPFIDIVHDRAMIELFRGCIRGCRFCQAGFIYRPVREKKHETLNTQAASLCGCTGYDEISLSSLSTSDYTELPELLPELLSWTQKDDINLALPSLRVDNFSREVMEKIQSVRKSSLTFAPEAGTQRLRDVINKNVSEDEIFKTCSLSFSGGWVNVKLYFMMGLPTENDEDVEGIAQLAQKIVDLYYSMPDRPKGKSVNVTISVAVFVPKPFTPFQWEAQDVSDVIRKKQEILRSAIKSKKISCSCHFDQTSFLEAVFARGDRRLADTIEAAWHSGCRLDGWGECFDYEKWRSAFEKTGLDPAFYANRKRPYDEVLPWDHINYGVDKAFLLRESKRAYEGVTSPNCREKCGGCGASKLTGGVCNECR